MDFHGFPRPGLFSEGQPIPHGNSGIVQSADEALIARSGLWCPCLLLHASLQLHLLLRHLVPPMPLWRELFQGPQRRQLLWALPPVHLVRMPSQITFV
jgi:hypothetical protein